MSLLSARWRNTRLLLRGWPSAVLLVALVANLTYSIQSAAWVPDSTPILVACLVGLGVGGLLVATRWPGWVSGLYSFLISLLWGVQALGKVIPPPGFLLSNPLLVTADAIRLKFFAFFLRAGGWVEALRGGGLVNDTGLVVLLFSVLGWNAPPAGLAGFAPADDLTGGQYPPQPARPAPLVVLVISLGCFAGTRLIHFPPGRMAAPAGGLL